jgi:hypothetical protein
MAPSPYKAQPYGKSKDADPMAYEFGFDEEGNLRRHTSAPPVPQKQEEALDDKECPQFVAEVLYFLCVHMCCITPLHWLASCCGYPLKLSQRVKKKPPPTHLTRAQHLKLVKKQQKTEVKWTAVASVEVSEYKKRRALFIKLAFTNPHLRRFQDVHLRDIGDLDDDIGRIMSFQTRCKAIASPPRACLPP